MKKSNKQQQLIALYKEIPEVKGCKTNCNECCGIVPVSSQEQQNLGINRPFTVSADNAAKMCLDCDFSSDDGCTKYNDRPFMCRLFGAVDDKILKCPHGAKADKPLSAKRAAILRDRYAALMKDTSAAADNFLKEIKNKSNGFQLENK